MLAVLNGKRHPADVCFKPKCTETERAAGFNRLRNSRKACIQLSEYRKLVAVSSPRSRLRCHEVASGHSCLISTVPKCRSESLPNLDSASSSTGVTNREDFHVLRKRKHVKRCELFKVIVILQSIHVTCKSGWVATGIQKQWRRNRR